MASEETEFKIKGAASDKSSSPPASVTAESPEKPAETDADVDVKSKSESKSPVAEADEVGKTARKRKAEEIEPDEQDKELRLKKAKYRWFKCEVDPNAPPGPTKYYYYLQADTLKSQWEEPDEPFWVFDVNTGEADVKAGLQNAWKAEPKPASVPEGYQGYIPSIHGNYDPTAPYAKWHEQKRAEEAQAKQASSSIPSAAAYESVVTLNRFTGHAQRPDLGPERHSDSAKAGRQLNSFFDPEAAANAHDGRSLKEERKQQQLSKKQIQEYAKKNKEKKIQKQRARYLS